MRILMRVGGASLVVLACGWLLVSSRGLAGEGAKLRAEVLKIADTLEKGDKAAAKKQAKELAKAVEDIEEVMGIMSLRKKDGKGGAGIGKEPGAVTPDGIEKMIMSLGQKGIEPEQLGKHAKALERMAYTAAAVMEVALAKEPEKDMGTKTIKLWRTAATSAHATALELARAAQQKDAAALKQVASRLDRSCNDCHMEFK
jgi:hypothetical protein